MSKTWEKELRELIENWHYQAGDDVLASALADESIIITQSLLTEIRERVEGEKFYINERYSPNQIDAYETHNHAIDTILKILNEYIKEE